MTKLIILGSSNAVPGINHDNTHMLLYGEERKVLIDCGSNPILRLRQLGLSVDSLTDVLLTHFHPDHMSGVPPLLMCSWLLGRRDSLNLHGLSYTLDRIRGLMGLFDWKKWPDFFALNFQYIPDEPLTSVLSCAEFDIFASPVHHVIPNIGLRIETKGGTVVAYSSDTEPCDAVVKLASGADILIHESNGGGMGHSSAKQAGEIAVQAGAKSLYLIHYPTWDSDPHYLIDEAKGSFGGPVFLAEDLMEIELN